MTDRPYRLWTTEQIRHQLDLLARLERLEEQLRQQDAEDEQRRQTIADPGRPAALRQLDYAEGARQNWAAENQE
jgi:hypothetical protein